ncbi:MAG: hypothetical protein PHI53_03570 [Candidatus Pacebacteria bacterium]|nr:hypothetical protein [Candidatus Paceibacterota bacterium]
MTKKLKRLLIPATALTLLLYGSALLALGAVIGYIATSLFCKRYINTGKIDLLIFDLGIGDWKLHLHHWLYGSLIIITVYFLGLFYKIPVFWIGALNGLIFHDLYTDEKWDEIIFKEEDSA